MLPLPMLRHAALFSPLEMLARCAAMPSAAATPPLLRHANIEL